MIDERRMKAETTAELKKQYTRIGLVVLALPIIYVVMRVWSGLAVGWDAPAPIEPPISQFEIAWFAIAGVLIVVLQQTVGMTKVRRKLVDWGFEGALLERRVMRARIMLLLITVLVWVGFWYWKLLPRMG